MNIKTATTIDGVNTIDFGNTPDRYYWCRNIGDTCLHVSTIQTCTADTDNVAILNAGESTMLENYGSQIYVHGAGKIEIHEQETPTCPFKTAARGGEASLSLTKLYSGDITSSTAKEDTTFTFPESRRLLIIEVYAENTSGTIIGGATPIIANIDYLNRDYTQFTTWSYVGKTERYAVLEIKKNGNEINARVSSSTFAHIVVWCM